MTTTTTKKEVEINQRQVQGLGNPAAASPKAAEVAPAKESGLKTLSFSFEQLKEDKHGVIDAVKRSIDLKGVEITWISSSGLFDTYIKGIEPFFITRNGNKIFRRIMLKEAGTPANIRYVLDLNVLQEKIDELAKLKEKDKEFGIKEKAREEYRRLKLQELRDKTELGWRLKYTSEWSDSTFTVELSDLTENEVWEIASLYRRLKAKEGK